MTVTFSTATEQASVVVEPPIHGGVDWEPETHVGFAGAAHVGSYDSLEHHGFGAPEEEELVDTGARLVAELERDFKWYLDDPLIAGLAVGSGGFGAQLEKAECYGYGAIPCRKCGGRWKQARHTSDGEQYFIEWRDGTGWFPSAKYFAKSVLTYEKALTVYRAEMAKEHRLIVVGHGGTRQGNDAATVLFAELGVGKQLVTQKRLAELFPSLPPERCRICDRCKGIGVVPRKSHKNVEITVRPTGSSVGKAGRHPDSMAAIAWDALLRFGRVERVLENIALTYPLHRLILASYYGPTETPERYLARRARSHAAGRPGSHPTGGFEAVWPLTPSAREWLDSYPRRTLDQELAAIKDRCGLGAAPEPAETPTPDAPTPAPRVAHADWLSAIQREAWALYGAACANATMAASITGWRASEAA